MAQHRATSPRIDVTAPEPPPQPGPEHKLLDVFVGKWNTQGETTATTDATDDIRIAGVDTYEWLPGGFFLVHRVDVQMGDHEVKAIEIIGYDASTQTYPAHSFDNQGNAGTFLATVRDGIWSFTRESERATVAFRDGGDALTAKWERTGDGSTWVPWMEVRLTRAE